MRQFYCLLLVVLSVVFIACKTENKNPVPTATELVAVPTQAEDTSSVYKKVVVKKIEAKVNDLKAVSTLLDAMESHSIDIVNWADKFPSKPTVSFNIAHNGDNILLKYRVLEDEILGQTVEDNGPVWTDSAVEFFIMFGNDYYYNAEFNCIGTALLGYKQDGNDSIQHASPDIMKSIKRLPSLEHRKRDKEKGNFDWTLTLVIPKTAYWKDSIGSFDGMRALGNFFKCGDNLTTPHYLSWTEIDTPNPSFHQPDFFGELEFE